MNVSLLNYTSNAIDMLLFVKSTRLGLNKGTMNNIAIMDASSRQKELTYIANTIPSSWEFVDYTFLIEGVSRAFTHQLVRTRTGSYAQEAMRIVDKSDGYEYIYTHRDTKSVAALSIIKEHKRITAAMYKELIEAGQLPEDARGILPTNVSTSIICKFNLRAFADLVRSRSGGRTQNEYRTVVFEMVECVLKVHPWAEQFLFKGDRNYFDEIEAFAEKEFVNDLFKKANLLKIVDRMRKEQ